MSLGTLGKYELLEKIAEGGMGELFRARSIGPGDFERIVALKRIRATMVQDEQSRRMFIEEAKIASFVSHPNLVHLYDFGGEGDSLYLVMELVEGRDLARLLARCRKVRDPLRMRLAVRIAEQVATGLDYLHRLAQKGQPLQLVHRDVSPQNVLISYDGVVKLTDFGIARMRHTEPVTQVGTLKGKMGYMTPEQLSEVPVDGRADIFCLGIVLWEMLTGGRLFQGASDAKILEQVLHKRIPLPSTLNVDVPEELDRVVMQALQRDRSKRFDRAGDMASALQAIESLRATDQELGQELRRYFPEAAPQLPSVEAGESRTESVSTSIDRPELRPPTVEVSEQAIAPLPPKAPPAPPPVTATATVPNTPAPPKGKSPKMQWAFVAALPLAGLLALALYGTERWAGERLRPTVSERVPQPESPSAPPESGRSVTPVDTVGGSGPAAVAEPTAGTDTELGPAPSAASQGVAPPTSDPAHAHRATSARPSAMLRAASVHPWAEVVVDGHSLGYTAGSWKVAAGHHHLLLRNGTAGIEREFDLEFPAGAELLIRGSLRSLQPEVVR